MATVSVIVPTYNHALYIRSCLDSIRAQTFQDLEIIVVNDGSTDSTEEILGKYEGKIHHIHQENRGPSSAKNRGIRAAQGKYLAFLDSDDIWLPEKLEKQIPILDEDDEVGIVFSDASAFDDNGIITESILKEGNICTGFCFERLFMGNYILMPTVVLRRSCLERTGFFDEELPPAEDYELWLRISAFYKIEVVNEVLARYRIHQFNISKNISRLLENEIKALKKIADLYPERAKKLGGRSNLRFCDLWNLCGLEKVRCGDVKSARNYFIKAVMERPFQMRSYYYYIAALTGRRGFAHLRDLKRSILRFNS